MNRNRLAARLTGLLLAFILIILSMPLGVFAAADVAIVNGQKFTDVKKAWDRAIETNCTIIMLADWKISEPLRVKKNYNAAINMDGHVINRGIATTDHVGKGKGQVFYLEENATLNIDGGVAATPHPGYIDANLWFAGSKSGKTAVTLTGGVIMGGGCDDSDGAGAFTMSKNSKLILDNVNVAGNVSDTYIGSYGKGGAIRMTGTDCKLTLRNSKIVYNYAHDDGGAIYIDKEGCEITLYNSEISHNYSGDEGGAVYSNDNKTVIRLYEGSKIDYNSAKEGGGVYFNYSQFTIKSSDVTGSVSHNKARDGHGGGIYIRHYMVPDLLGGTNYGTVHGLAIEENSAKKDGGAIYLDQESISISSCNILNNTAENGGGIYNNNDKNNISSSNVRGNRASKEGGGIYTSSLNDFGLGGKMIIKDNTRGDGSADDLFLNDSLFSTAYLNGAPSGQSEVGIRISSGKERQLGVAHQFFYENAFFYDLGNSFHIEFLLDKEQLWIIKGPKPEIPVTEVSPITEDAGIFNGEPLRKGYFSYCSAVEDEEDHDAVFFYSDGFFLSGKDGDYGDPKVYNEHLATTSMTMAMSAFYSNIGNDGSLGGDKDRKYTYKSQNIERFFHDIGVDPDDIFISESNTVKPGTATIGVAIGQKSIGTQGEILVPVAVRGSGYESEWFGNTTVGSSGEHEGFAIAADQVFKAVQSYIRNYGLEEAEQNGKLRFWIAGYSRAGATSNLTAKRLIEEYCAGGSAAKSNKVYAYCFEAPKGGLNSEMKLTEDKYYSIHNCINKADLVPLVAPEEMGFIRYGVDHFVPGDAKAGNVKSSAVVWSYVKDMPFAKNYAVWYDNNSFTVGNSNYKAQRDLMLDQLKSIDPINICFYDGFHTATIQYLLSSFGGDLISIKDSTLTQEQFNRLLVRGMLAWGFYGCYTADFRKCYSLTTGSSYGTTFEQALQLLTKLTFGKSGDEKDGIFNSISELMQRIDASDEIKMKTIWSDMIGNWCNLKQDERDKYANIFWKLVVECKDVDGNSVSDFLTPEEKDELHSVWYTILDVLLRFVASDYKFDADAWYKSHAMVPKPDGSYSITNITEGIGYPNRASCQIMLGTLAFNASAILQAHYPEINLAWLRSYDNLYVGEGKRQVKIKKQSAPEITVLVSEDGNAWSDADETYEGGRQFKLTSLTTGAGIYYRIKENDGAYSDWMPFNKSIALASISEKDMKYTIQYTAVYCGAVSDVTEKTFLIKPAESKLIGSLLSKKGTVLHVVIISVVAVGGIAAALYFISKKKKKSENS